MKNIKRKLALVLIAVLLFSSCGKAEEAVIEKMDGDEIAAAENGETANGETGKDAAGTQEGQQTDSVQASTMRLVRREGEVALTDGNGAAIPIQDGMRLFDGNALETQTQSRAGISLDDVKSAVLGEVSAADVHQDGKYLEMDLSKGELYFSVAQPLTEDERFEICTSSMTLGIRGTSGYVSDEKETGKSSVILTSGHAVITSADGNSQPVEAGQKVTVTLRDGRSEFFFEEIGPESYPDLLAQELLLDTAMLAEADAQQPARNLSQGLETASMIDAYREILQNAASYDYGANGARPTGVYKYALEKMNPADTVPALLLSQETDDYMTYVRVFQYDPGTGTMLAPTESIMTGAAGIGGFRGGIGMQGDGNGIRFVTISSQTGETHIYRITVSGNSLAREEQWTGILDNMPDAYSSYREISWYDVQDPFRLNYWSVENAGALPEDGGRIVLTGTISLYTHDEVVALQGIGDEISQWAASYDRSRLYRLFVLDTPQYLELSTVDGTSYNYVTVIGLYGDEYAQYDGQHVVCSIDPMTTQWPSDISLPYGQPATRDLHILTGPSRLPLTILDQEMVHWLDAAAAGNTRSGEFVTFRREGSFVQRVRQVESNSGAADVYEVMIKVDAVTSDGNAWLLHVSDIAPAGHYRLLDANDPATRVPGSDFYFDPLSVVSYRTGDTLRLEIAEDGSSCTLNGTAFGKVQP